MVTPRLPVVVAPLRVEAAKMGKARHQRRTAQDQRKRQQRARPHDRTPLTSELTQETNIGRESQWSDKLLEPTSSFDRQY